MRIMTPVKFCNRKNRSIASTLYAIQGLTSGTAMLNTLYRYGGVNQNNQKEKRKDRATIRLEQITNTTEKHNKHHQINIK